MYSRATRDVTRDVTDVTRQVTPHPFYLPTVL